MVAKRKRRPLTCMLPNCSEKHRARGLCDACWHSTRARVKARKTTWDIEVTEGRAKPIKKKLTAATRAFRKRTNGQRHSN